MAAVVVLLMGVSLLLLTSVVVFRAVVQAGATRSDARWEQALYVAESGLNLGGLTVQRDEGFTTGETAPPFADRAAERAWVVAAADGRPDADLMLTPEGEFVIVRPGNSDTLYSVGYVPARDDVNRRVRVVSADIGSVMVPGPWIMEYAFLTGADLELFGNPSIVSGTSTGVHANGSLDVIGTVTVDGCVGAVGSVAVNGNLYQGAGCDPVGGQDMVDIPDLSPRQFWYLSQYDLCPGGAVKAGPAHPVFGNTVANRPCTGATLMSDGSAGYVGWSFRGCCDGRLGAQWDLTSGSPPDGIFYVYKGSARISGSPGSSTDPWQATLLVEGEGSCSTIVGGDVEVTGGPKIVPHPYAQGLSIIAGRDLRMAGTPQMGIAGIIGAYEQIYLDGNLAVFEGGFIAQEACDSVDDFLDATEVGGSFTLTNTGDLETPFVGVVSELGLSFWDEL
jgi:hypothetical protein